MALEKTLVLLKPCTLQRALVGEITNIFERKGLRICGMKMMQLTDEILSEHYAHLSEKPFFQRVKDAMMTAPVIALCLEGVDAIAAVRALAGPTNGRNAAPGTIRGSYCMSFQENIVHASDSPETAEVELKRFFRPEEIFDWKQTTFPWLYALSNQQTQPMPSTATTILCLYLWISLIIHSKPALLVSTSPTETAVR